MNATATPLAPVPARASIAALLDFTPADIEAVKALIAPGAPDSVVKLVLYRCQQLGCDPLGKNIYAINRPKKTGRAPSCPACGKMLRRSRTEDEWYCWRQKDGCGATFPLDQISDESSSEDNWVLQSSIDLFRSIAESSEGYRGQDGAYWCGPDGTWRDVWLGAEPPAAARVGILRASFAQPLYTVARFSSYCQEKDGKPTGLWAKMPEVMISKCAEALAIRRAFPQKLAGIYIAEEMDQADNEPRNVTPADERPSTTTVSTPPPAAAQPPANAAPQTIEHDPPAVTGELPPSNADEATLRAWLGKRLGIRAKSWTADHMGKACAEVAQVLGLDAAAVTPRTLGKLLPQYREALAKTGAQGAPAAADGAKVVEAAQTAPEADSVAVAPVSEATTTEKIDALLRLHGIADDDEDLQNECAAITDLSGNVRYVWRSLDEAEKVELLYRIEVSIAAEGLR